MANTAIIKERIAKLQSLLKRDYHRALIINTADPHLSEYIADHWKTREFFSGFTGSAGTLVVGENWAGLWTDSRYHLQAEQQLQGTGITLYKEGLADTPTIAYEIGYRPSQGFGVGIDPSLVSQTEYDKIDKELKKYHTSLCSYTNHYTLWEDRPPLPNSPIFVHELEFAGESASSKLERIRRAAIKKEADYVYISGLDEIAWTLNLRGSDIAYNPVFYAFLAVEANGGAHLFVNNPETGRDLNSDPALKAHLQKCGVSIEEYKYAEEILYSNKKWLASKDHTNSNIVGQIKGSIVADAPTLLFKAVKNDTQLRGLEQAQLADGVAMTQAFCWLDDQLAAGNPVSELSFANHLDACRAKQQHFFGLSFNTISGFAHHGAIVHYGVTPETDIPLEKGNFLLVDSGGNYLNGTTDITRTVFLGEEPTLQQKQDYTLVLKGHIALATTPFPEGTAGAQLDTLARMFLWKNHKNYGHGTGHGIGHFLCVHEGPHRISARNNNVPLQPGMLISNEPGLYIEGQYGIRLENMVCVKDDTESPFGKFFKLETMSFFPFCNKAISASMLTTEELAWLNSYHKATFQKIAGTGLLTEHETAWLANKTAEIANS